jgi:hypothetical protein
MSALLDAGDAAADMPRCSDSTALAAADTSAVAAAAGFSAWLAIIGTSKRFAPDHGPKSAQGCGGGSKKA